MGSEAEGTPAGGYFDRGHRETPLSQLHTYKAVYATVQRSIDRGGMLKGVLFWRWAGVDPTLDLSSEDEATTLGTFFLCLSQSCLCNPCLTVQCCQSGYHIVLSN